MLAQLGQTVLNMWWYFWENLALHDSISRHLMQALGKHLLADAGNAMLQLTVSFTWMQQQFTHDQNLPLTVQQRNRGCNWAAAILN